MLTENINQNNISKPFASVEKPRFMSQKDFERQIEDQISTLKQDVVFSRMYDTMTAEQVEQARQEIKEKQDYLESVYKPEGISMLSNMKKIAGGMFARGKAIAESIGQKAESVDWNTTANRVKTFGMAAVIGGFGLLGNPAFAKEANPVLLNSNGVTATEQVQNHVDEVNSLEEATQLDEKFEYEVGDVVSINGRNVRLVGDGNGEVDLVQAYKIASNVYRAPSIEIPVGAPKTNVIPGQVKNTPAVNQDVKVPKFGVMQKLGNWLKPKVTRPIVKPDSKPIIHSVKNNVRPVVDMIDPSVRPINPAIRTDVPAYPPITVAENNATLKRLGLGPTLTPPPFPNNFPSQSVTTAVDISGFNFPGIPISPVISPSVEEFSQSSANIVAPTPKKKEIVTNKNQTTTNHATPALESIPKSIKVGKHSVVIPENIGKLKPAQEKVVNVPEPKVQKSVSEADFNIDRKPPTLEQILKSGRPSETNTTPTSADNQNIPNPTSPVETPDTTPIVPPDTTEVKVESGLSPIGGNDNLRNSVLGAGYYPTAPGVVGREKYGTNLRISRPNVSTEPVLEVGVATNTAGHVAGSVGIKNDDWGIFVKGNSADGGSGKVVVRKRF